VTLLADLDAFYEEHERCRELDSAVSEDDRRTRPAPRSSRRLLDSRQPSSTEVPLLQSGSRSFSQSASLLRAMEYAERS